MIYRVGEIKCELDEGEEDILRKVSKKLGVQTEQIVSFKLFRKSVDARHGTVCYSLTVDAQVRDTLSIPLTPDIRIKPQDHSLNIPVIEREVTRPVVVGFGPAGMFCGLVLSRAGLRPLILERGKRAEDRVRDVDLFMKTGVLDPESNVQFGEGGAGTFSDGKLNSLVRDKDGLGRFVLESFVRCGAPEEILWQNKPHVGTDQLCRVVRGIRKEIESYGGEVLFETRFDRLQIENRRVCGAWISDRNGSRYLSCDTLFLAPGHSARNVFASLRDDGIPMEKKAFSVGVRIEHKQSWLNERQYGLMAKHPKLPAADYKVAVSTKTGKTLYSFCMCPGGVVIPAASETGGVVTNGMSRYLRDGENCNAALLVSLTPEEIPGDLFAGFAFQKQLEESGYRLGGGGFSAPCQTVGDFLKGRESKSFGKVIPSYARGVKPADLSLLFPSTITETIKDGILKIDGKLNGFASPDAVLTGPESRATSPVRILRGEDRQSDLSGLYPIGEGAGYAGGILSAAMDGIRSAEQYVLSIL